ncbi:MAG: condensation domain-containing protein [Sulfitobacter sp.]
MVPLPPPTAHRFAPVSSYQAQMITAALDPETSAYFDQHKTIRWAFRIGPAVPARTLRRAFERLTARHDSLRLKFVERQGRWQAEILPKHATGLMIEDLAGMTPDAQEATILARALAPMNALSDPLFEMQLLKGCEGGDVVLTRAHHSIIDGYSIAVMIEELLKIVLNMPLSEAPPSHADFIALRNQRLAERVEEKEVFWRERLLPLPADLMLGRTKQGLGHLTPRTAGKTIRLADILTRTQAAALETRAKATGVSAYALLHAAFSETMCLMGGEEQVLIHSVLGRQDTAMSGFVGADMQQFMTRYVSDPTDIDGRARWVADQIAEGSAQLPTHAFAPEGLITQAFAQADMALMRFHVHISYPKGRLANSPFGKLFEKGREERLLLGHITLERVPLPGENESEFEIEFLIGPDTNGSNATLIADAAGYATEDMEAIAQAVKDRLGLSVR